MPSRDLGFLAVAAVIAAVVYLYARRRWRISVDRAAEVKRLTWLAVEESARAELESEALAYVAPLVNTVAMPSYLMEDEFRVNDCVELQCAVCFRRTSTRCSRCKAVRYCSGKCQIVHWRQGHKDNCHPPKIDHVEDCKDKSSSLKESQTIKSSPSECSVATETISHSKQPLETISARSSDEFNDDRNRIQSIVDGHGTKTSSDLPSDSSSIAPLLQSKLPSSAFSKQSKPSNDAAPCDEPHVPDSENKEASSTINSPGVSTLNIEQNVQCSKTVDIKSSSSVSSRSNLDAQSSKQQPSSVANRSTEIWLLKEKSRRPSPSLVQVNNDSSNATTHTRSENMLSRNNNVPAVYKRSGNMHRLSTRSAENIVSIPNNISELKTSVMRAVQHFKSSSPPKLPSESRMIFSLKHEMSFPYDLFVKLYNCDKVDMRPCGLTNCGNSCFANAVLQCLAFTRPLKSYLLHGYHAKTCPKERWCFTCEFASLLVKAKQGQTPLSPIGILSQIHNIGSNLSQGRQEDAHEFLRYAVDAMQMVRLKETGIDVPKKMAEEASFIQMIFGGYLLSKIKCMRCRVTSERLERMMDLTVEIQGDIGTLEEALARFTATETLDGDNKYECSRCKSYERAKKKLTILEAPNVLTIALKRFQSGKFGKLNKQVHFPEALDLSPYMSNVNGSSQEYDLYAVVVHQDIMNAAFSGHYICYVKSIQNKWYKTDDSKVKSVDIGRVLSNNAYLLFYARCSPKPPRSIENTLSHTHEKHKSKSHNNNIYNQNLPYSRSDASSDSSSLFSFSDEGSCSTRDSSTSTEELSDTFRRYSSTALSEDSDFCPISSPFSEADSIDSPRILFPDSTNLTGDNNRRNIVFRRSNATRERR